MLISTYWDNDFDVDAKAAFPVLCNVNESEKQGECSRNKL